MLVQQTNDHRRLCQKPQLQQSPKLQRSLSCNCKRKANINSCHIYTPTCAIIAGAVLHPVTPGQLQICSFWKTNAALGHQTTIVSTPRQDLVLQQHATVHLQKSQMHPDHHHENADQLQVQLQPRSVVLHKSWLNASEEAVSQLCLGYHKVNSGNTNLESRSSIKAGRII